MTLELDCNTKPNVLLLGNGILKLGNKGASWDELISKIKMLPGDYDYKCLPYAMQPEAVCGVDVEEIQRRISDSLESLSNTDALLDKLLDLNFDAIITTNYTYEIERMLSPDNKWSSYKRKKAFTALDGNYRVHHNTYVCNIVKTATDKLIPVFHVHGECERKHSMILSYYSYANSLSKLIDYNKKLGNSLLEHQIQDIPKQVRCWLDYFIMGNVWSVGFGLDVSEVDIWWAIERKAREKAKHGFFKAYLEASEKYKKQGILLNAMNADYKYIPVEDGNYTKMYSDIIEDIELDMS